MPRSDSSVPPADDSSRRSTRSSRKRWLFRGAAIAIGLLPFFAAEALLRSMPPPDDLSQDPIFDTGKLTPLFVRSPAGGQWEIPESRSNFFRPAAFPIDKSPRTRRVFVLGASTVQGRPYATETAFPFWLSLRLRTADPDHGYEVINCGGVSYASYRIAAILDEVLTHSPDGIILYTGHNEFLEERSYDTLRADSVVNSLARRSRLVGWMQRSFLGGSAPSQALPAEVDTRLDSPGGMERYVRDDAWRRAVVEHFGINLRRMILRCKEADVPLVLCLPVSDCINTPPMKIAAARLSAEDRTAFESAWSAARNGELSDEDRITSSRVCLRLDPEHAGAHFVLGSLLWKNGDTSAATPHLIAARDHDVCPLRATTPILEQIESASRRHDVPLIRFDRWLDRSNANGQPIPDGVVDPDWFVDHIHPSVAGHQQLAQPLFDSLSGLWNLDDSEGSATRYASAVAEHLQTLDEAYFARGKQRLEGLRRWASGRAGTLSLP